MMHQRLNNNMNPFKKHQNNPEPDPGILIDSHEKLWSAVTSLRISQARSEERIRYNWLISVGVMASQVAILSLVAAILVTLII